MSPPQSPAEAEFRAQLQEQIPRLRRFCIALAGSRDAGEDLLQSALERALVKHAMFREGTRLDHWLFRLARNLWIDEVRKARARGGTASPLEEAAHVVGSDGTQLLEERSELSRAGQLFAALPQEQREVFALVVIEGLAYREAAEMLDIPMGTVMSRLARARLAIEQGMRAAGHGEGHDD